MKKIMKKALLSLLFCSFIVSSVYAESSKPDISELIKAAESNFKQNISFYQKLITCTPASVTGAKILGKVDGKCHYSEGAAFYGTKQEIPLNDCYLPMSVAKSYAQTRISEANKSLAEIKKGHLVLAGSTSVTSSVKKYCKSGGTITIEVK